MKYLLDVNVLIALIWEGHSQHEKAISWLTGKRIIICPLVQLGFLRISTNKKAINAPMGKARELLAKFTETNDAEWLPDNFDALLSRPKKSEEVTDMYLADLAAKYGAKLVTFDRGIVHASVDCI